jgi:hypothetical protein
VRASATKDGNRPVCVNLETGDAVEFEIVTPEPDEVELYRRLTDRLWEAAAEGDAARPILVACAQRWAQI